MLWTIFGAVFAFVVLVTIVTGYRAIYPGRRRVTVRPPDLGLPCEDVRFTTADGISLAGWFLRSPSTAGVIICLHGYPSNRSEVLPLISFLYPEFSLLFFDLRAHGESTPTRFTFGDREKIDVAAAVEWVRERCGNETPIGLWGHSMGGVCAILYAAEASGLAALVTDSGYANFEAMTTGYYQFLGPLKLPVSLLARWCGRRFLGDYARISAENAVGRVGCPILLIHSSDDRYVPVDNVRRLYDLAHEPKEVAYRTGPHDLYKVKYSGELQSKVRDFYRKTMG